MSEADNSWRLDLDGQETQVEVEHSTMTGRVLVTVNGRPVAKRRLLLTRKEIPVDLGSHRAQVSVSFAYLGFGARSALHLDGRYVEPLHR